MNSIKNFNKRQLSVVIFSGIFLWYMGTLLVKYGGSIGFFQEYLAVVTYITLILSTWLAIKIILTLGKIPKTHTLTAISIATCSAIGIDAIALIWFRELYGTDPNVILGDAATILWGAFVPLMIALYLEAIHSKK